MIIAKFEKSQDTTLILVGLSDENVKRLLQGKPIYIGEKHAGQGALPPGYELGIMHGKTEQDIYDQFKAEGLIKETTIVTKDPRL